MALLCSKTDIKQSSYWKVNDQAYVNKGNRVKKSCEVKHEILSGFRRKKFSKKETTPSSMEKNKNIDHTVGFLKFLHTKVNAKKI